MINKFYQLYEILFEHFGPQSWWPADSRFEVMVGAILTQNTKWENVEKAISRYKRKYSLDIDAIGQIEIENLASIIRPAGYHNIKARRLKNLVNMINEEYDGDLELMASDNDDSNRHNLLNVNGIGPETADSIMLYALEAPFFVVDAYTYRILYRHQMIDEESDYYSIQQELQDNLPEDIALFNEYHALIVLVGKKFCKKSKPLCEQCPLYGF